MSPPRTQCSRRPERTNGPRQVLVVGQAQDAVDTADPALARHTVSHSRRGGVSLQDPYAYYKAFLNTESSSTSSLDGAGQHGHGGTTYPPRPDAQSALGYSEQQLNKPRPVPYSVAVRSANRSSGAPLATIVEQGSVSTLNSRGSLLRFPSIRTVENASPSSASHKPTRSLDEAVLNRIQEEGRYEPTICRDTQSEGGHGDRSKLCNAKATAAESTSSEDQKSHVPRPPELDLDLESKGLKGFLRSVLTKVRSNTQSRSRSSSSTDLPVPMPDRRPDVSPTSQTDRNAGVRADPQRPLGFTTDSTMLLRSTRSSPRHVSEHPATHGSNPTVQTKPSAEVSASKASISPSTSEPEVEPIGLQLPPISDLPRIQCSKEVLPPAFSVPPKPRDAVLHHGRTTATTVLSRSRDELASRHTPDGAFAHRNDGWSLDDFARNASLNASFCSTMSTSYSGTVLGIDLDIQHDFQHATRRSVTPVWFSPKETGMAQEPNREFQAEGSKPLPPRSITSPALMSLLPIAAAEGIVQHNLTTPQLTFYSPSGNLIQAQDASPIATPASRWRSGSNSYFPGTPITTTSYYNGATVTSARSALCSAITSLPERPAPVPLTTPPQSTSPLPEHLRHHHNFHRVDRPRIGPMHDSELMLPSQIVMTSDSQVPGCNGIVREANLDPHSGALQSSQKHSEIGSSMSCLHVGEAHRLIFHTSSFLGPKSACRPKKGHTSARKLRKKGSALKKRQGPRTRTVPQQAPFGPVAGHALRVCFCQPYDGVGRLPGEVGCGGASTTQLGGVRGESHTTGVRETTPNARIVTEGNGKGKNGKGKIGRGGTALSVLGPWDVNSGMRRCVD